MSGIVFWGMSAGISLLFYYVILFPWTFRRQEPGNIYLLIISMIICVALAYYAKKRNLSCGLMKEKYLKGEDFWIIIAVCPLFMLSNIAIGRDAALRQIVWTAEGVQKIQPMTLALQTSVEQLRGFESVYEDGRNVILRVFDSMQQVYANLSVHIFNSNVVILYIMIFLTAIYVYGIVAQICDVKNKGLSKWIKTTIFFAAVGAQLYFFNGIQIFILMLMTLIILAMISLARPKIVKLLLLGLMTIGIVLTKNFISDAHLTQQEISDVQQIVNAVETNSIVQMDTEKFDTLFYAVSKIRNLWVIDKKIDLSRSGIDLNGLNVYLVEGQDLPLSEAAVLSKNSTYSVYPHKKLI